MFHKPKRRYNSEIVFSEDVNQGTVVERALTETDDQSDEDTDHEDEIDEANDCMAERIKNQQRMPLFNLSESQSRLIMTVTKTTLEGKSDFVDDLLERTALWKTVRVLAWIKRFVINYRSNERNSGPLRTDETDEQLKLLVKRAQDDGEKSDQFQKHFQRLNLQKNEERIYVCQGIFKENIRYMYHQNTQYP